MGKRLIVVWATGEVVRRHWPVWEVAHCHWALGEVSPCCQGGGQAAHRRWSCGGGGLTGPDGGEFFPLYLLKKYTIFFSFKYR